MTSRSLSLEHKTTKKLQWSIHELHQNKAIFAFNHTHKHVEVSSDVSSDKFSPLRALKKKGESINGFPIFCGKEKKIGMLKYRQIFAKVCEKGVLN